MKRVLLTCNGTNWITLSTALAKTRPSYSRLCAARDAPKVSQLNVYELFALNRIVHLLHDWRRAQHVDGHVRIKGQEGFKARSPKRRKEGHLNSYILSWLLPHIQGKEKNRGAH